MSDAIPSSTISEVPVKRRRRTPCVGICSTTYGDLVCRGCRRFAHEIVQWNGYDMDQREQIWQRLEHQRDAVVGQLLMVEVPNDFAAIALHAQLDHLQGNEAKLAVLGYLVKQEWPLHKAGLRLTVRDAALHAPLEAMRALEEEMYERACAVYERNFKVSP
ncbi:MAG: DUF1289 domain-containing protein [Pseudomonadota bacterium]